MSQAGIADLTDAYPQIAVRYNADVSFAIPILSILNIVGGPGVTTVGSGNTITINLSALASAWTRITADQTLGVNKGYFCVSPGGALSLALPAVSVVGDEIEVSLDGATSFTITQGAGQSIKDGNVETTAGVGGSLSSTQQGDTFKIVCSVANLRWNVISEIGNLTIV